MDFIEALAICFFSFVALTVIVGLGWLIDVTWPLSGYFIGTAAGVSIAACVLWLVTNWHRLWLLVCSRVKMWRHSNR